MSRSFAEITEDALQLPAKDQFKLARTLLENAQYESPTNIEAAWEDEIERRIAAIRSGAAKGRPFADVLQDIDKILAST